MMPTPVLRIRLSTIIGPQGQQAPPVIEQLWMVGELDMGDVGFHPDDPNWPPLRNYYKASWRPLPICLGQPFKPTKAPESSVSPLQ